VFYNKTKRQKQFLEILKFTKKKYSCDPDIEKNQGWYEFNVYGVSKEELEKYLKDYNVKISSIYDEGVGSFLVVKETTGGKYESLYNYSAKSKRRKK
jgi:hypothetical protein